jgi:CheY-like chemotaxis protein
VLLIEDDPLVLEGNEAMLEDWGCSVVGAASISEAVRAVGDKGVVPDVILADFHLCGKETGPEAVAAVNELLLQPIQAIFLTGDTDLGRIEQASASKLFVLHKPVEPERLRAAILEAIHTELAEAPDEVGQGVAK